MLKKKVEIISCTTSEVLEIKVNEFLNTLNINIPFEAPKLHFRIGCGRFVCMIEYFNHHLNSHMPSSKNFTEEGPDMSQYPVS